MADNLNCLYVVVILVIAIFLIIGGIRVVPENKRLVVFRLGRPLDKSKGSGIVFLIPIIDRAMSVDLGEHKQEVLDQTAVTQNSIPVLFSFVWYYKVIDPVASVVSVGNFETATAGVAVTTLRALIGDLKSVDLSTNLKSIQTKTRIRLDEVTERWGVRVNNFEILKIAVDDQRKKIDDANFVV